VLEKAREAARTCCRARCSIRRRSASSIPDFKAKGAPLACRGARRQRLLPDAEAQAAAADHAAAAPEPRQLHHLAQPASRWLGEQVEAEGIDLFTGFPASVGALRRHARGRRAHRRPRHRQARRAKSTFEPGADIRAKVTIFADGVRGNLTKELTRALQLGAAHPGSSRSA
jgi:electron-transferring-flavoprotein dehydrogenase